MSCYIRLRGLPWSVTHQEIFDFLKNVNVVNGTKGIHMVLSRWDGKNTGEAFVELASVYDEKEALKLNKLTLGHRYIEATNEEAQHALKNPGSVSSSVVKLRGLPFAVTEEMIEDFFNGLNLKRNREGILIVMDRRGRATGEAYVQFESVDDTEQALLRNREKIGHRYIEIFRSSLSEMRRQSGNRPGPYDIKDRGGLRNRDDFGGNLNILRDTGYINNNKNGFGDCVNKPVGMKSSGNGLNLSGFGMFGSLGGCNNNCDSGNNFDRSIDNNMGLANNFSGGCNNREKNFNQGLFWNNDMNKNMREADADNGRAFANNSGFSSGIDNDGNNFNNAFDRGNSRMNVGVGMMSNKMNVDSGKNNFGNIRDFQNERDLFCVHMRGLPYNTFENEVFKFFDPVRPTNVKIIFNNKGLHSGSADAFFYSYDDSQIAMKKHMEQIGSRYIELFFDGKAKGNKTGFTRQNNQIF